MANDVSYFRVAGDSTVYSFNDADSESRVSALETSVASQGARISANETDISTNATNIQANKTNIGTLSNLTTSAKGNLVAAINEVDTHADTNASNIAGKTFKSNSYAQAAAYTISLPKAPRNGMTYMVVLKHYMSSTTFAVDIILLTFTSETTVYRADVVKNSTTTINSISVSGSDVTLTFAATAYLAAYAISLV